MSKYKINVITVKGILLTFHISSYKISEGSFVEFIDERTGLKKKFHASNCEVEEINYAK